MQRPVLKIGHRGAMGHATENTLSSFQKAISLGVDIIELDCLCCKSKELVVFHDDRLLRLAKQKGFIREKTLSQLKEITLAGGERIPTLKEALECIDRKAIVNIELKGRLSVNQTVALIRYFIKEKGWAYNNFLISTFVKSNIRKIKRLLPEIPVSALALYTTQGLIRFALSINAHSININKKLVNEKIIRKAHAHGLNVYVWTVNDPKEIQKMKDYGVDGIFSDYPERI